MGGHRAGVAALGGATPTEADRGWPLVVRRARPADRDAVLRFATRTWDGWDYIPHAWPVWLEATDGVLLVACVGRPADGSAALDADGEALAPDQPIAVARVALLTADQAWLEGIRVDPRVRGLGVATDLQTAELHWLAPHHVRVVRYATGARNEASHRLGGRHGFELLTSYRTWAWRDPARPDDEETHEDTHGYDEVTRRESSRRRRELLHRVAGAGRIIEPAHTERWWGCLAADARFVSTGRLYELRSWAFHELTETLFGRHVAAGEVVVLDSEAGWALAIISAEVLPSEDASIHLALVAGHDAAIVRLAGEIREMANEPIRLRLSAAKAPAADSLSDAFAAYGFVARPWELHILARSMDDRLPAIDRARLALTDPPERMIRP